MSLEKLRSVNMTPQQGMAFAQKLATDDKFRQLLSTDPENAFSSLKVKVPAGLLKKTDIKLPPKELVADALSKLKAGQPFTVPGKTAIDAHYAFFAFFAFIL